jgi:peptide deformylase
MRLPIRKYGDPILRKQGKLVTNFDEFITVLAQNMIDTMHEANGVGLAAQQIGEPIQLAVIDVSEVEGRPSTIKINGELRDINAVMPLVLINPEIISAEAKQWDVEGCLSIPGVNDEVLRPAVVSAVAADTEGQRFEIEVTGLIARALQHEMDHLKGVLFTDRLTAGRKLKWRKELRRLEKRTIDELSGAL